MHLCLASWFVPHGLHLPKLLAGDVSDLGFFLETVQNVWREELLHPEGL